MRIPLLRPSLITIALACLVQAASAQRVLHWVGGNGVWSDAASWALTANGAGGAGVPEQGDLVVVAPAGAVRIQIERNARCAGLRMEAASGVVELAGRPDAVLEVSGDLTLEGSVRWTFPGTLQLGSTNGPHVLHTRGIPLASGARIESGRWRLSSDLVLRNASEVLVRSGELDLGGNLLKAGALRVEGRRNARIETNAAVVQLEQVPQVQGRSAGALSGNGLLLVQGSPWNWQEGDDGLEEARNINICGTGPGQTQFIVEATLQSSYNGFGVSCKDACDGVVTVTVSGGIGPFTYQWVGGPTTATWSNVCAGNQIVIITDQGQGVSCATTVNVTDPARLSVIFFGLDAPSCADVCDGSSNSFAVGGAGSYNYLWNGGAETGASAFQLCPGINTLTVTDVNNCLFDTTFVIPLDPVVPNLLFTEASCFGECDGTASVAPEGGTGSYTYQWVPVPPVGQGTPNVAQLCPGPWEVTITDGNGCDTTVTFTITQPPPIEPNPASVDATCAGACDGAASVAPSGAPGPFSFLWLPEPGAGQGSPDATGLCAGEYTVLITDQSSGCDTLVSFTIEAPDGIDPQPSQTDATCADACDGMAGVAPTGGTGTFVFLWSPPPPVGQATANASGLCPGTWQVTITDQAGCDTTVVFEILAPAPIDPQPSFTDITCAGACDGTATVDPVGGVPGYTFLWDPPPPAGQGTPTASGLCAGAWSVLISDANGCDTLVAFNIAEPPPIEAVPEQTDVTCGGACDGTASVQAQGGTGSLTYLWTPEPPQGQGSPSASQLCAGAWSVLIEDDNGCTLQVDFLIEEPNDFGLSLQLEDATCPTVCDGSAGIIVTGGTEPYAYVWSPEPGAGQGTPSATGLCPQAYLLVVSDAAGCDTTIAFTIEAPEQVLPNETVTDIACAGDCNGAIDLAPTGGDGTYTFVWDPVPPNGQGNAQATGLCAGIYQVTVTSGGCDTTLVLELTEPPPFDVFLEISEPLCADGCDATASIITTGGTGPYTYSWDPEPLAGQGTATAIGLCAGPASVLVGDALGCDTLVQFVIDAPAPFEVDLLFTNPSCGGGCDGTAEVQLTGGTPPYSFLWSPEPGAGQGTPTVTGLCPGTQSVLISDDLGCDTLITFTLVEPSAIELDVDIVPASCEGLCDGLITLDVTIGQAPYTFAWSPEPGSGQGTPVAGGLCAGEWTVLVTDAAGCDTLVTAMVPEPPPIIPNEGSTDETCNGPCDGTASVAPDGGQGPYTFLWSPAPPNGQGTPTATGLCAGDWSVHITDAAGCDTLVYFTILPEQPFEVAADVVPISCANACDASITLSLAGGVEPFSFLWEPDPPQGQGTNVVGELCPGTWTVTVTDALGCDTTLAFQLSEPPPIIPGLVITPEACAQPCSGAASASPSGGLGGPYTFLWSPEPGSGQGTSNAEGLCTGINYTVTISDAAGCDTTLAFVVPSASTIEVVLSSTPESCAGACDGTATVGASGGVEPYSFLWTPEPAAGQGTPQASGLCPGVYNVTIGDAIGCDTTVTVLITGPAPFTIDPVVQESTCNGDCLGAIVLFEAGGTPPYTFLWDPVPANGNGENFAFGLCAGPVSVVVSDANGCDTTFTFLLTEPPPIAVDLSTVPSACQQCLGSASVVPSGGIPPYTDIVWTDPDGVVVGNGPNAIGLCAGIHQVTVTDAAECIVSFPVTIVDADGEELDVVDGSVICPSDCDGEVSVLFTCTDPPCIIQWYNAQGDSLYLDTPAITGLCPGEYLVEVVNASGCLSVATATVVAPPPFAVGLSSTPVTCAGGCDGTATVGVDGGTGPYLYAWSPEPGGGQGSPLATGLCAGVYEVQITDAAGCDTTVSVLILEPLPITIDASVVPITCAGACDASIVLSAQGGNAPYTFNWQPVPPNGQGGNAALDLCPGLWVVTISDANGCDSTLQFLIEEPDPLALATTSTESECLLCNGTASVTVTGGVQPYLLQWTDADGNILGDTEQIEGLCAGLYGVLVIDASGCQSQSLVAVVDGDGEVLSTNDGAVGCGNDCVGEVSVDFNCSAPPCTVTWTDQFGNVIAQDQNELDGLCPGEYYVQVLNGNGCLALDTAQVAPAPLLDVALTSTPVACAGGCDGTATVGVSGGVEPYTYSWNPEPQAGQGTPQATGLCAGVYEVLIEDAAGCDTTVSVLILEPDPLLAGATISGATCHDLCDGSIVIAPSGGTGPYTFAWTPVPPNGDGSNAALDLCAGEWSVTITDANNCDSTFTFTIGAPEPIVLSAQSTPSECGLCNGAINLDVSGGTGPFIFAWTDPNGVPIPGEEVLEGLCGGLYAVEVIDANGCAATLVVPVNDLGGEDLETNSSTLACPGDCDGEVGVDFDCAEPVCTIVWFDALGNDLGQSTEVATGLCAGMYLVQVTNGLGCITIDTAYVFEPDPIEANLSTTQVSCYGECDGTATVAPTGGQAPYSFLWEPEPINGQGTAQATDLCAGTYSVLITDDLGCELLQGVLILEPDPLTADATELPITCAGECDAAIILSVQGGTAPYAYAWTPEPPNGQGGNEALDLCAGTWSVTITDETGCQVSYTYEVTEPTPIVASVQSTSNLCFGDCDAVADLSLSGGVEPYSISWTDPDGVEIATDVLQVTDLCGGEHLVVITDASGCAVQVPFTVGQGDPIETSLAFTDETCFGPCDGTASVVPGGGDGGPYTILWNPEPQEGQGTEQVIGLCAGPWSVTIADGLGCDTTLAFTILPYQPINADVTLADVGCADACDGTISLATFGGVGTYTYLWAPEPGDGQGTDQVSGLCPGLWTVTIADAAGCDTLLEFTITEPPSLVAEVEDVVPASCNNADDGAITIGISGGTPGYTVLWTGPDGFTSTDEDLAGIGPGPYSALVTDLNGCTVELDVEVPALTTVVADAGIDQLFCAGQALLLDGSGTTGATDLTWTDGQGNVVGTGATVDLGVLPPGSYTFTLVASDGPCDDTDQVTITILASPPVDAGPDQTIFINGTAILGGSPSGPDGATFAWMPDSLLSAGDVPNPLAQPTNSTWFYLTVTDPNGCQAVDSVLITVLPELVVPTGFTPNGDGWNDQWIIDFIDLFPNAEVEVYNRWGELLFQSVGYRVPWDGRYRGGLVPVGTYYYVIKLNDPEYPDPLTGPLTVIR